MDKAATRPLWRQALEDTDWSMLCHAYGTAGDTPAHLHALLGENPDKRTAAEYHLNSAIIHQGTPWPATAPVTTIVAGMLMDTATAPFMQKSRQALIDFLTEVDESIGQMSATDWPKLETMAAHDISPLLVAADYDAIYGDEDAANALFAQSMLDLRNIAPLIRAGIAALRP
ncbi:hypothetical protein [Reyranella sp. CPCC 100927]|uniref:hypothetical protein n=1 Tax=Reyranella sp. CPCC 100927 TaxID=2599616 RepID=UPI0011B46199|nr:hypothetical protein [Reyranella sp. CPCC 100927]TWT01687.1 hypothetical protein FQU96_31880 [Reyranella sp. CPCC 100927]